MEGKIIFDLSYPLDQGSSMIDLYPTEMIFHFKNNKMHSEIKSSYDILTTDLIIDCENRTFVQLLKNMSKRYGMKLNENETKVWYDKYPTYTFEKTDETIVIAGYVCNKTIAHVTNDSLPPIELYHTKGLGIEISNWWNPFSSIDGFLMGYDVDQYGMCMRLRAREVKFEIVDDKEFEVPANFEMIDASTMDQYLREVVEEYVQ